MSDVAVCLADTGRCQYLVLTAMFGQTNGRPHRYPSPRIKRAAILTAPCLKLVIPAAGLLAVPAALAVPRLLNARRQLVLSGRRCRFFK